ncbi:MAG: hypothetical protein WBQ04_15240 [Candidatus Acidiferrales bacterium]
MIFLTLCAGSAVCAQAQDARANTADESWTATTQTSIDNTNPLRTTESHTRSGNRSVDKQKVEVLGTDGGYRPDHEIETETIRVNDTTTRTVVRTYKWDANGQRSLMQVTEEEARNPTSGDAKVVRTTSSRDVNGNLRIVEREVADTKKTSSDGQQTKTTVYLSDGNGGFTPSRETQELQKRGADSKVEVKTTTLLPGANGNWELLEMKEKTIKEEGKNRISEESVSRPDPEGRLSEVSRTVSEETENAAGEKGNTVETYSIQASGIPVDGSLHLNQRVTSIEKRDSTGRITEQQVEQPDIGNPSDGVQVNGKNKYTVKYAASSAQQTKTVEVRGANGTFTVFSTETQKSEHVPPLQAATASPDKSK